MKNKNEILVPSATIHSSFSYGWQQMWKYFLHLFLVTIVMAVADSVLGIGKDVEEQTTSLVILQLFAATFWLLVYPVLAYGADFIFLKAIRNQKIRFEVMIQGFKKDYFNIVLAHLLATAIIVLGFVFFIIPGIIFACRLVFVPFLVMDKGLEPVAAVEKSWNMTKGYGWDIFVMGILSFFIIILGVLCLIVGVFFSIIWISTAFASLYHAIDLEEQKILDEDDDLTISIG